MADDRILEYLLENDSGTPKEMMEKGPIRYTRSHIARRCRELRDRGYIVNLGNAAYSITEKGEAYLSGEHDAETGEPVDSDAQAANG